MKTPGETLTSIEAAKMLKASIRTVQLWVEDGRLKAWKTPGGHRRIARESVEAMLASRQHSLGDEVHAFEILLVEDDAIQLKLLEKALMNLLPDAHVRSCTDGYAALIRIGERRPDLLVTDLMMPGMDGFHLLKTLERELTVRPIQIIVQTSLGLNEIEAAGGLGNGVTLLQKPLNIDVLRGLVKAYHQVWQLGGRG